MKTISCDVDTPPTHKFLLVNEDRRFWNLVETHDFNGLIALGREISNAVNRIRVVEIICDIPVED